jgi:hypothetical protein
VWINNCCNSYQRQRSKLRAFCSGHRFDELDLLLSSVLQGSLHVSIQCYYCIHF